MHMYDDDVDNPHVACTAALPLYATITKTIPFAGSALSASLTYQLGLRDAPTHTPRAMPYMYVCYAYILEYTARKQAPRLNVRATAHAALMFGAILTI